MQFQTVLISVYVYVQANLFSFSGKSVSVEISIYKTIFSCNCCVYLSSGSEVSDNVVNSFNFCVCASSGKGIFIFGQISFYLNFCLYFFVIMIKNKFCKQI